MTIFVILTPVILRVYSSRWHDCQSSKDYAAVVYFHMSLCLPAQKQCALEINMFVPLTPYKPIINWLTFFSTACELSLYLCHLRALHSQGLPGDIDHWSDNTGGKWQLHTLLHSPSMQADLGRSSAGNIPPQWCLQGVITSVTFPIAASAIRRIRLALVYCSKWGNGVSC